MLRKSLVGIIIILCLIPIVSANQVNTTSIMTLNYSAGGDIAILESKYEPTPAEPGNHLTLWVSIQNWGEKELYNNYFRIKPEFPFYLDPWDNGIRHLGIIDPFREKLLEFKLKVTEDVVEGDNTIDLAWCGDPNCQTELKVKTITINVKTGGAPDLLTLIEDSAVSMPGSNGEVSIGIINKGKLDVKFLTVTLMPGEDYEILSPNQLYVGELDSDDSDSADFDLHINGKEGKIATLPLKFEYSDANYKKYIENRNIDLRIYSSTDARKMGLIQGGSNAYSFVALGILILGGYFVWKWWKKKQSKKHHKS